MSMSSGSSKRVPGHSLVSEGRAFEEVDGGNRQPVDYNRTSGTGFAICTCGARSDVLDSANKRKAWHRQHKAYVLNRRGEQA